MEAASTPVSASNPSAPKEIWQNVRDLWHFCDKDFVQAAASGDALSEAEAKKARLQAAKERLLRLREQQAGPAPRGGGSTDARIAHANWPGKETAAVTMTLLR